MEGHRDRVRSILNFYHLGVLHLQSCRVEKMWLITWDILGTISGNAVYHFHLYSTDSFLDARRDWECQFPCAQENNEMIWQISGRVSVTPTDSHIFSRHAKFSYKQRSASVFMIELIVVQWSIYHLLDNTLQFKFHNI